MPDKKQINPRLKKLEQTRPIEPIQISVDWSDFKDDDEPTPGELWLIWEQDGSITTKRGNLDGTVTVRTNQGAEIQ